MDWTSKESALYMIRVNRNMYNHIAPKLKKDVDIKFYMQNNKIIEPITSKKSFPYKKISKADRKNRAFIKDMLSKYGWMLKECPEYCTDREMVLTAVGSDGKSLAFTPAFCDDDEVVKTAIENDVYALEYTSKRLQTSEKILTLAEETNGYVLLRYYIHKGIRPEKEVVLRVAKRYPKVLQWYMQNLIHCNEDWADVKMVFQNHPEAFFDFANTFAWYEEEKKEVIRRLEEEESELLQLIIKESPCSMMFISKNARHYRELCRLALKPEAWTVLLRKKTSPSFYRKRLNGLKRVIKEIPAKEITKETALALVAIDPELIKLMPAALRRDKQLCMTVFAVCEGIDVEKYIPVEYQNESFKQLQAYYTKPKSKEGEFFVIELDEAQMQLDGISVERAYVFIEEHFAQKEVHLIKKRGARRTYGRGIDHHDFEYLWMLNMPLKELDWFMRYVTYWTFVSKDENGKIIESESLLE